MIIGGKLMKSVKCLIIKEYKNVNRFDDFDISIYCKLFHPIWEVVDRYDGYLYRLIK